MLWQYWPPKKHQRYEREMWEAINVTFRPPDPIEHVIASNGVVWTPPLSWLDEPTVEERSQVRHSRTLSNGKLDDQDPPTLFNTRSWPTRRDFYNKVSELKYTNVDAFRGLIRLRDDGQPPPRVSHARTFYKFLDDLVQYWDTSKDEYIPPEVDADSSTGQDEEGAMEECGTEDEPRKRARLAPCQGDRNGAPEEPSATAAAVPEEAKEVRRGPWKRKLTPPPIGTYRGWRIDTGKHMPAEIRENIVKSFIDMALWPFHLHVDEQDRAPPRLAMEACRIGVPLTRRIWRNALTRSEAREGTKRGPALGVSCRQYVDFAEKPMLEEVDLLRELGVLVLLGQERRREGRAETRAGAGKWWSEVPRFGGLGYQVPGEYQWESAGDDSDGAVEAKKALSEKVKKRGAMPSDMTPKQRAINAYKLFLPGPPLWDPKVKYAAIGKPSGDYDEVCFGLLEKSRRLMNSRSSLCRR